MGNLKESEEKFKKEISKEIANLKEFLIQQGKEIVKIKQEQKSMHFNTGTKELIGLSPDLRTILDKQQSTLDRQKENTTKLSKLCLGTLTELEKMEKLQQERFNDKKTEEKIKKLSDENKRLIQMITSFDKKLESQTKVDAHHGNLNIIEEQLNKLQIERNTSETNIEQHIQKKVEDIFHNFEINTGEDVNQIKKRILTLENKEKLDCIHREKESYDEELYRRIKKLEDEIENSRQELDFNKKRDGEYNSKFKNVEQKLEVNLFN